MKKFLLYLLVLVFMVSFVGLVFYLTREDETISASSETVYLNLGEESTPSYVVENQKKTTKVAISSSNETVAMVLDGKIVATNKGFAVVSITMSNARGRDQVIQQKIYVGDGSSSEYPIYIRNEFDFKNIGNKYSLDLFFKQTADITFSEQIGPIDGEFSGQYNGNGHKITSYKQSGTKESSALFDVITGTVGLLTFENVDINGSFENASVLANTNKGLIDYVEVVGKITNTKTDGVCGGVVANNVDNGQIQRCVSKLNIVSSGKVIGGIAAYNNAIITACQNGDTSLKNPVNSNFEFESIDGAVAGGIVAKNEFIGETNTIIANNFSVNQIIDKESNVYWFNGTGFVKLTSSPDSAITYVNASGTKFVIDKTQNTYFVDNNSNATYDNGVDTELTVWDSVTDATTANITFASNCFLGGIVGVDYNSGETPAESESKKTTNIFGNYYLISADYDLVKRGIGSAKDTVPANINSANLYIANGVSYETVSDENSMFVSYVITFDVIDPNIAPDAAAAAIDPNYNKKRSLESWPTDVWVIDEGLFPYLISVDQAVNKLSRLSIKLPTISVVSEDFTIDSVDKFILYARTGLFTRVDNAGKTYYITNDLDFTNYSGDFVMVGSEERPVVVNFEGLVTGNNKSVTLSNIVITSATKYRKEDMVSTIAGENPESIGIFGVVSDCKFSNFNLKDCKINAIDDITSAKNVGSIAGKVVNSTIENCIVDSGLTNSGAYVGLINAPASAENVGTLFGKVLGTTISNCKADIEISRVEDLSHGGKLYIGGDVGYIDGKSAVNYSSFSGKITTNVNINVYAGGAVGFVSADSAIESFSGKGFSITSAYAGGIAAIVKGQILNSSARDTLEAKNAGGFVYSAEDSANISQCYCETTFTLTQANVNAGMACELSRNSRFTNCVNVNDFNNMSDAEAGAYKNYSRTKQNVKFEFDCGGKITELNEYGSGYAFDEVILTNCFYVNRVNGSDSNDYNKTTFYMQTNASPYFGVSLFGAKVEFWNRVDEKVVLTNWYNGSVRNGRLKTTGGLVAGPNTSVTWADFGFSESIWSNASSGIMNATLYIA